ncbi:type IV pilin protein [Legionella israelensis]|uniref:Type IV pilin protein n=1 Tax=Legionella israelensis TaxID=454 RepID=A0AAX1EFV5_9GAMM|nr:type IV pilin protein [Legionella israelensis]QBR84026.1 type IV pilin protein [Legionella israelensis]
MKTKGFSLIELLIVMVIAGILVSIAYPAYREYITRARRSDGQAALLDLASRMERYYSEENTYQTATIGTGNPTDVAADNLSPEGWYTLVINATANTYTLQAVPRNAQATNDTRCQTLTLNNQGVKSIANGPSGAPTGTAEQCW